MFSLSHVDSSTPPPTPSTTLRSAPSESRWISGGSTTRWCTCGQRSPTPSRWVWMGLMRRRERRRRRSRSLCRVVCGLFVHDQYALKGSMNSYQSKSSKSKQSVMSFFYLHSLILPSTPPFFHHNISPTNTQSHSMRDHGVSSRTHADEVDRHAQHLLDVLHVLPRILWQLLEGPHTTLTHRSLTHLEMSSDQPGSSS